MTGRGGKSGFAALALAAVMLPALQVSAQEVDTPLLAWLGCWVPIGPLGQGSALCFQTAPDANAVEMIAVADGRVASREMIRGAGERRATGREGCEGWEEAQISGDGRRVYTRSALTCDDGLSRSATGVMSFVTPTQWLDVRSTYTGAERVASAQYYQLASNRVLAEAGLTPLPVDVSAAVSLARRAASIPPNLDHVTDASEQVDGAVVEAWIAEVGEPFRFNGEDLVRMVDAGVPESVVDAVVAVSFPQKFTIDRGVGFDVAHAPRAKTPVPLGGAPLPFAPFYYGFGYSYLYRYGYPGFGYGYDYWYPGYRPIYVTVRPRPPVRTARVVNGRGYTQGRSRLPGGTASGTRAGSVQRSGDSYRAGGGASAGSGSTPRKAKRRRPGGNGP